MKERSRGKNPHLAVAALPLSFWLVAFLAIPIGIVFYYSFLTRGPYGNIVYEFSGENYLRLFDPLYGTIFLRSALLAAGTTLICLVVGFPTALAMATAPQKVRSVLFLALMLPFLTNFIVRVYALRLLLSVEGPLNLSLLATGLLESPLLLNDSMTAIIIGMITNYLPFMVLPIYVVLDKIDYSLVEAASDLGASWQVIIRKVLVPLARPGLVSGSALVVVPVLGEFMVPDLLGGAKNMLIGNLIAEQFLKARDWPFGAAIASVLIVAMIVMASLSRRRGVGALL